MQTFIIIWLSQTISIIGSSMTAFAFTIWVWELTGQATALALFGFFTQLPQVFIALIAGAIVDRTPRKYLIILGDTLGGLVTIIILLLYLSKNLQLWHLYLAIAVKGIFEQLQQLAYSASISVMVSKQHYSRVSSMGFLATYGASIIAPALAGILYPIIGLFGILTIDITTFAFAVSTLLLLHIPQPPIVKVDRQSPTNLKQDLSYGWSYIAARPSLLAILVSVSLFWFANEISLALYSPMILARSGNDARVLGNLAAASGIGGVVGALFVSNWGGFKRRIKGVLFAMMGVGLSKTVLGLGNVQFIWIPAQFCSSFHFPLLGSSNDAIWLSKVKPEVQGRVFATRSVVELLTSAVATLMAGLLADYIFEPAMMPDGSLVPILGGIFGTGTGAGMALLYVISSMCLLLTGLCGYAFGMLRNLDRILPDHDIVERN